VTFASEESKSCWTRSQKNCTLGGGLVGFLVPLRVFCWLGKLGYTVFRIVYGRIIRARIKIINTYSYGIDFINTYDLQYDLI
jgi:hypothetical protein